jgi:tetratricopeptide (TPR) repeat protein
MLLDWARALKELGRPARAAAAYARAVALAPAHPRAHLKLGMTLRQLGRRGEAADAFRWGGLADAAGAPAPAQASCSCALMPPPPLAPRPS